MKRRKIAVDEDFVIERDEGDLNWIVMQRRDVKSRKDGSVSYKWMNCGVYFSHLNHALKYVFEHMVSNGDEVDGIPETIKMIEECFAKIEAIDLEKV